MAVWVAGAQRMAPLWGPCMSLVEGPFGRVLWPSQFPDIGAPFWPGLTSFYSPELRPWWSIQRFPLMRFFYLLAIPFEWHTSKKTVLTALVVSAPLWEIHVSLTLQTVGIQTATPHLLSICHSSPVLFPSHSNRHGSMSPLLWLSNNSMGRRC